MNNFYGRRFLSSLLGALSVLSSPVASAKDDKLGKGNLKGRGGASARRDKNNGKLGGLESNRKVKSVNDLEKVLKETGGKVVGVSPDGKGGFVAFIKTPTGAVVTLAIVSVPLAVIISWLVFFRRKNREGIGGSEKVSGGLLDKLFGSEDQYGLFVSRLFKFFFDDGNIIRQEFSNCGVDLGKFLESVFKVSYFGGNGYWRVGEGECSAVVSWKNGKLAFVTFSRFANIRFVEDVFLYLSANSFFEFPEEGEQASWGDRISAVLFSFWCSVEFNLDIEEDAGEVKKTLCAKDANYFREVFRVISGYVRNRLEAAGKDYNGQKLALT